MSNLKTRVERLEDATGAPDKWLLVATPDGEKYQMRRMDGTLYRVTLAELLEIQRAARSPVVVMDK